MTVAAPISDARAGADVAPREKQWPTYVLVTPVRNEQATIGITIESVIRQTVRPVEWVIVSDESVDRTDEIVKEYAAKHDFIKLLRLTRRPGRNFGSVVFATEAGIAALTRKDYQFIGLLDADIKYPDNYYEEMLKRFAADPKLGLAGGYVIDIVNGQQRKHVQSKHDVAGAVQFFRRECFEALGGLIAMPEGGWDAVTCFQTRMRGYKSQTFFDIEVDHLKPRNIAEGNLVRRTWQLGIREYALGNHPIFEFVKCGRRCFDRPYLIGGVLRFAGYVWCGVKRRERRIPADTIAYIRKEQLGRLFRMSGYQRGG